MKYKVLMLAFLSAMPIFGKFHQVASEKAFNRLINEYPYAVVCFAQSRPEDGEGVSRDEKREMRSEFRDFREVVKAAADSGEYERRLDRDVGFFVVDSTSRRAQEIDDDFSLSTFPTCILFKEGKVVSHLASYAQIVAPITKSSILELLEKKFNKELKELIKERKEEEKAEREERLARYAVYSRWGGPYGGWGWGYGYPYAGYGWGGPGWGWNRWGWGGYWC